MLELAEKFPTECIKYHSGFAKTFDLRRQAEGGKTKPYVVWLAGPTGCGKTFTAFDECKERPWVSSSDLKWFDGYVG